MRSELKFGAISILTNIAKDGVGKQGKEFLYVSPFSIPRALRRVRMSRSRISHQRRACHEKHLSNRLFYSQFAW
jgi:hypothetical protein